MFRPENPYEKLNNSRDRLPRAAPYPPGPLSPYASNHAYRFPLSRFPTVMVCDHPRCVLRWGYPRRMLMTTPLPDPWLVPPPDDTEWRRLLAYLPPDLEASARRYGAFLRPGAIRDATTLLRLLLATASGLSLDTVAARAVELQLVPHLTDQALCHRFQAMVPWVSFLVGQLLAGVAPAFPWDTPLRVRLVDASCLERPGATGTDWRLHLGLDLRTGLIDHLSVTGANIGERLADFPVAPGDVAIGDRNYGTRQGVADLTTRGAYALVRITVANFPLLDQEGQDFRVPAQLRALAPGARQEWLVQTAPTATLSAIPGRLVVQALPEEAANRARQKVRDDARKDGRTPTAETLFLAGFLLLFTTVPVALLTTAQVLALYGMRWQVEITFKRCKSALHLADIRATSDAGCYTQVLAKCLLLLLVERLARQTGVFSPSGHAAAADEPLSLVSGALPEPPAGAAASPHARRVADLLPEVIDTLVYGAAAEETRLASTRG